MGYNECGKNAKFPRETCTRMPVAYLRFAAIVKQFALVPFQFVFEMGLAGVKKFQYAFDKIYYQ